MNQRSFHHIAFGIVSVLSLSFSAFSQDKKAIPKDNLYKEFQFPPNAARPRVWWHWINGNITKDGIRKDLQNFDAGLTTPQVVEKR